MGKYIKDHKIVLVAVIFMLIVIGVSFIFKQVFFANSSNIIYGDRLKGIEKVKIDKDRQKKIVSYIENDSAVKKCKYILSGKIINLIITVNDDIGLDTAKSLSGKVLEKLSDKEKAFYDIEIFIKKDNDASDFPIVGYKQNKKDAFVWTKDRAAS